jgi:hypothetical protein
MTNVDPDNESTHMCSSKGIHSFISISEVLPCSVIRKIPLGCQSELDTVETMRQPHQGRFLDTYFILRTVEKQVYV